MRYQENFPGDWGSMIETESIKVSTEHIEMEDGSKLFLRSWQTASADVLLVLHGLGAHSGWFIDVGNALAARDITVYALDHRGFGRSEGLAGHIDRHQTYVDDIASIAQEIRERHPNARLYVLGHSMGGIFATHFAARYGDTLAGVLFLNPWVQDSSRIPLKRTLAILAGGLMKSRRAWQVAGGAENMTLNAEATRMLQQDPLWRRSQTSAFLVQILLMRLGMLKAARRITQPALVLQAEADKVVIAAATRKFYEELASSDKTWTTYPGYSHDTEFEDDHSLLDNDIADWIHKHSTGEK